MTLLDLIFLILVGVFIYTRFFNKKLPKSGLQKKVKNLTKPTVSAVKKPVVVPISSHLKGVDKVKALDHSFDKKQFLEGAEEAFKAYHKAVVEKDEETLEALLSPHLLNQVMDQIDANKKPAFVVEGDVKSVLLETRTIGRTAILDVRYTATLINPKKAAEKQEISEVWTWARSVDSEDPNWELEKISKPS